MGDRHNHQLGDASHDRSDERQSDRRQADPPGRYVIAAPLYQIVGFANDFAPPIQPL